MLTLLISQFAVSSCYEVAVDIPAKCCSLNNLSVADHHQRGRVCKYLGTYEGHLRVLADIVFWLVLLLQKKETTGLQSGVSRRLTRG